MKKYRVWELNNFLHKKQAKTVENTNEKKNISSITITSIENLKVLYFILSKKYF